MKTKTIITAVVFFLAALSAESNPLTLDTCYALAKENYPQAKQKGLIEKSREYSIDNAMKGYLPQINFAAQATYQSDVTQVPFPANSPFHVEPLSKDQYKFYGEVNQSLTDVFLIQPQKKYVENSSTVEAQKLEVELYKLKERINQLFFGALLIDGQLQQVELLKKDIQSGIDKVTAAIKNGVAYKSNLSELKAELLKADQRTIELKATRKAYMDMLGLFINQTLDENTLLEKPAAVVPVNNINRPELSLFEYQKQSFDIQNKLVTAKTLPRAGVFFQGGYARPGLNMLKNEFAGYYIAGIKLGWSINGFYTFRKDRKLLDVNRGLLDVQRETFLFNTNLTLHQQNSELEKLEALIKTDNEIISLRTDVKNAAQAQLENGVITTNDFLTKVNAEDQARQNLVLHQIQLLMAQYNYQTTSGN